MSIRRRSPGPLTRSGPLLLVIALFATACTGSGPSALEAAAPAPAAPAPPAAAPAPPAPPAAAPAAPAPAPGGPPPPAAPSTHAGLSHLDPVAARDVYRAIETHKLARSVRKFPERVYVPNSGSSSVDVIDPKTYKIVRHYAVGNLPHHITPSWNMQRLYVDNTTGDSLTVIDPATGRPAGKVSVRDPYNLYFTPDGSKAIVVAERFQSVDFRDPHTWRLLKSVFIPAPGPDHLDFSADGRFLLITAEFSGRVYRVNTSKMAVTGEVTVGGLPVDVKLSPDGSVFYVANQGLGGVSVIDSRTLHVLKFIRTGRGAHGLCISRDGRRLYVSNRLAGTISVIAFGKRRVVTTWHVGSSPDMMQVSPDGRRLWFSNRFNGSVGVADTRTGRLLHTIRVGDQPHGLTYFPQPGRFSVGHNGVYR